MGADSKCFTLRMISCSGGLDCGICQALTPPCSITPLRLSSVFTVHQCSLHFMFLPPPFLHPFALLPTPPFVLAEVWISQHFTLCCKRSLSPGLWGILPPSCYFSSSRGTATHTRVPVDHSDPPIAPWSRSRLPPARG